MNARQAQALLELIADLYTVASAPEPPPNSNGAGRTDDVPAETEAKS